MSPPEHQPPGPYLALGVATALLLALPPLAVGLTPVADLPQQLAQIPLLLDVLTGQAPHLTVHWLAPNKICYPLLGLAWLAFDPLVAARAARVGIVAAWVAAGFWMARRRRRAPAQAALAGAVVYNHLFGFGFFNFVLGLGAFLLWIEVNEADPERPAARTVLEVAAGGLLLYFSHALWLAAGLGWLLVSWAVERPPSIVRQRQALGVMPSLGLFLLWYPGFVARGWESISVYGPLPWERLSPRYWIPATLGAVHGPLEPALLLALTGWLGLGLWHRRRDLAGAVDRRLLLAALTLAAAALLLPIKVDKTLGFAARYQPMALVLLLLALPPPSLSGLRRRAVALAVVAAFALGTTAIWIGFEREELAGLREALEHLPAEPRVLGLDLYRSSPRVRYPAYLQSFAYAQLVAGGELNFSFTDLPSSLVVRRVWTSDPWTPHLEWEPEEVEPDDLDHFDFLLAHASQRGHRRLVADLGRLVPVTDGRRWRLYRVVAAGG